MKNLYLYIVLCFLSVSCLGQNMTTVTGTVTDSDAQAWVNASYTWTLYNPSGGGQAVFRNGTPVPRNIHGTLDLTGTFQSGSTLPNNSEILPTGTQANVVICSLTSAECQTYRFPINGSTYDLGTRLNTLIRAPRMQASNLSYAYNTTEIENPVAGSGYTNTVTSTCYLYQNGSWVPGCGGGSSPVGVGTVQTSNETGTSLYSSGTINEEPFNNSNNGIAHLQTNAACTGASMNAIGGCFIFVPNTSTSTENVQTAVSVNGTHVQDYRNGSNLQYYYNVGYNALQGYANTGTNCFNNFQPLSTVPIVQGQCLSIVDNRSGTGYFQSGSPSSQGALVINQTVASPNIAQIYSSQQFCYKSNDCGLGYWYQFCRGNELDGNAEGCVIQSNIGQDLNAPVGVVAVGGQSASIITPTWSANGFVTGAQFTTLSTNEIYSSGTLTSCTSNTTSEQTLNSCTTSDTHSVSTGFGVLTAACVPNVPNGWTPINTPIQTSCTYTTSGGFGTFTASSTIPVCIGDYTNYETAYATVVADGSMTIGITKPHIANAPIYQGGACGSYLIPGYGTTHPSVNVARPASYYIAGSRTSTTVDFVNFYKQGENQNLPLAIPIYLQNDNNVPAYNVPITSATRVGSTVTIQTTSQAAYLNNYTPPSGSQVCLAGNSDSSFNACGLAIMAVTNEGQTITYTQTGAATTGTGGTISISNLNNYEAIEGAETVGILGSTPTNTAGTQMQMSPNHAVWAVNSPIIQIGPMAADYAAGRETYSAETPNTHYQSQLKALNMSGEYYANGIALYSNASEPLTKYIGGGGNYPGHVLGQFNDWYQTLFDVVQPPINGGYLMQVDGSMPNNVFDFYGIMKLSGTAWQYTPYTHTQTWFGNYVAAGSIAAQGELSGNSITLANGVTANEIAGPNNPDYLVGGDGSLTPGNLTFTNNNFHDQDSLIQASAVPKFVATISSIITSPNSETIPGLGTPTHCYGVPTNDAALSIPVWISFSSDTLSANYTVLTGGGNYDVYCTFPTPTTVSSAMKASRLVAHNSKYPIKKLVPKKGIEIKPLPHRPEPKKRSPLDFQRRAKNVMLAKTN